MCREIGFQFRRTRISHCVRRVSPQSFLTVSNVDAVALSALSRIYQTTGDQRSVEHIRGRKIYLFVLGWSRRFRTRSSSGSRLLQTARPNRNGHRPADSSPNQMVVRPAKEHAIGNPRKRIRYESRGRRRSEDRYATRSLASSSRKVERRNSLRTDRVHSARSREFYSFERAFRPMNFSESRDATRRKENLLHGRVSRRGKTTTDRTIIRKLLSVFVENESLSVGENDCPLPAYLSVRRSATS